MDKVKPELGDMGIEIVEFDNNEQQISSTTVPLGQYLHDVSATEEEMAMTAQLAAMSARR